MDSGPHWHRLAQVGFYLKPFLLAWLLAALLALAWQPLGMPALLILWPLLQLGRLFQPEPQPRVSLSVELRSPPADRPSSR